MRVFPERLSICVCPFIHMYFEVLTWDLIALVPDHSLSLVYFILYGKRCTILWPYFRPFIFKDLQLGKQLICLSICAPRFWIASCFITVAHSIPAEIKQNEIKYNLFYLDTMFKLL